MREVPQYVARASSYCMHAMIAAACMMHATIHYRSEVINQVRARKAEPGLVSLICMEIDVVHVPPVHAV